MRCMTQVRHVVQFLLALLLLGGALAEARRVSVRGYTRRDGTYVRPYTRSSPGSGSSSSSGGSYTSTSVYTPSVTFRSCAAARAAGYSNIMVGSAGYSSALDRDGDGVACESGSAGSSTGSQSTSTRSSSATTSTPNRTLYGTGGLSSTVTTCTDVQSGVVTPWLQRGRLQRCQLILAYPTPGTLRSVKVSYALKANGTTFPSPDSDFWGQGRSTSLKVWPGTTSTTLSMLLKVNVRPGKLYTAVMPTVTLGFGSRSTTFHPVVEVR